MRRLNMRIQVKRGLSKQLINRSSSGSTRKLRLAADSPGHINAMKRLLNFYSFHQEFPGNEYIRIYLSTKRSVL